MPASDSSIKAGTLRHRGTILRQSPSSDVSGTTVVYVPLFSNVPCGIEPTSARDIIRSGQTVAQTMIPITMRYMDGIAPNMQFQWVRGPDWASTTQIYVIQGIINVDERNRKLVLMCLALQQNT